MSKRSYLDEYSGGNTIKIEVSAQARTVMNRMISRVI